MVSRGVKLVRASARSSAAVGRRRRVVAAGALSLTGGLAAAATLRRCSCAASASADALTAEQGSQTTELFAAQKAAAEHKANQTNTNASPAAAAPATAGHNALPPGWHREHFSVWRGNGTPASFDDLVASAAKANVVLMGEEHDDRVAHAVQLDLLAGLHARLGSTRELGLAMEMFETDVQPVLDDYLGGHIREKDFLMDARPWNNYESDYRPLVEFAKDRGLRVLASNAPRRYVSLLGRGGGSEALLTLSPASQALLPPLPISPPSEEYKQIFMGHMAPAMQQRTADKDRPTDSVWVAASDDKSYEVEAVVAQRVGPKGAAECQVKWLGFGASENTWELTSSLLGDVKRLLPDHEKAVPAAGDGEPEGACPYVCFSSGRLNAMLDAQVRPQLTFCPSFSLKFLTHCFDQYMVVQSLWDASMAHSIAQFFWRTLADDAMTAASSGDAVAAAVVAAEPTAGLVLHINGSFHSRGRRGIPERLAEYCHADKAPTVLVVTCASCEDVSQFPAHLAPFAASGGTGDDFIIMTNGMVDASFEISHPI